MMSRLALIFCLLLGVSSARPQGPVAKTDWGQVAENSRAVVVGVVEDVSPVINADKQITKTRPAANGQVVVELQNPADYIVGRLVRLRIKEVWKSDGSTKPGRAVNIFLPGYYSAEGQPALATNRTYLLFLNSLKASKDWGRPYIQPSDSPAKKLAFVPRLYYRISDSSNGALGVTAETRGALEQAKAATRKTSR